MYITDLTGKIFGKYTVISYIGKSKWLCKYSCGDNREVRTVDLNNGNSKGCRKCTNSYEEGEAGLYQLYSKYKRRAFEFGRTFNLNIITFKKLTSGNCKYCGQEPIKIITSTAKSERAKEKGKYKYNGIDRKDSSLGYTIDNSVSCCEFCNKAKRDMKEEDFLNHLKRIAKYYETK